MPEPKWYTKKGADGKWYKTQAASPEEATAKFGRISAPSKEFLQGNKENEESAKAAATEGSLKHFWEDFSGPPKAEGDIESNALRKGVDSTVNAFTGIPGALYHAAADPESSEESRKYGEGFEKKIGPTGRVIDRMAVQPTLTALDWYKQVIQGKISDPAGQALTVGNEAVGTGAGGVLGGKISESIPDVVKGAVRGAGTGTRILGQEIAGAGKEPVYLETMRRNAVEKERIERYNESAQHASSENAKKLRDHMAKVKEAQDSYQKEYAEYQKATADKKLAHGEKVKSAQKEWVQKSYEAKRLQAAHEASQSQLQTLKRGQDAYSKIIKQNVEATHKAVKADLDSRWTQLNEQVGKQTPLNSVSVRDAIEEAKSKFLMGSPESLKVFNDLTRQMTGEGSIDASGGPESVVRPLTWEEGRVHYSALGDRMYSGELPGNVYKGVGYVRNALDRELAAAAKSRGAGQAYASVKSDWSRYMDDWRDMGAISTGGSPLARVLRAEDPGFVAQQVSGKAGERMAQTLGRYKKFGGNPESISKYRALGDRVKSVPKVRVPSAPGKLELPAEPKMGEAPEAKQVKPPEMRPGPRLRPVEDVDPVAIRSKKLTEMAGRPFRFYDLFPPYLIEHMAVKNPAIREWLATQPREELKP